MSSLLAQYTLRTFKGRLARRLPGVLCPAGSGRRKDRMAGGPAGMAAVWEGMLVMVTGVFTDLNLSGPAS